jgi:periplasmic divalent cation tolerance protein
VIVGLGFAARRRKEDRVSDKRPIVVLATAGSADEAGRIARALVEEGLAACANIVAGVRSIYRWEGRIVDDTEWLLVIKTEQARFAALEARVRALHSYTVPEVIAVEIVDGSKPYLEWLLGTSSTAGDG